MAEFTEDHLPQELEKERRRKEHERKKREREKEKKAKELANEYQALARLMEEAYAAMGRSQIEDYLGQLDEYMGRVQAALEETAACYEDKLLGKMAGEQKKAFQMMKSEFEKLRKDRSSKFKIYIRGCGKAGKSTLLNALLGVDQEKGSGMDLKPMTFTIDTFTDELGLDEAVIRRVDASGNMVEERMGREAAKNITKKERDEYNRSEDICRMRIREATGKLTLQTEIEDVSKQIIEQYLMKSDIRETVWGIGKNEFLSNCMVVDTPGLGQELDSTNRIKLVKEYEMDGILWVVSTDGLNREDTVEEYEEEMKKYADLYENKKLIGVINVMNNSVDGDFTDVDATEFYKNKKVMKRAGALFQDHVADIVCVNNKLAYEGMLENDPEKIRKSNLEELKAKINLRFVEKSSDEAIEMQAGRARNFCTGFEKNIRENISEIEKLLGKYEEISRRIDEQIHACYSEFDNRSRKIIASYRSIFKKRAEANANYIQNYFFRQDEFPGEWNDFIRKKIIVDDGLQQELAQVRKSMEDLVYDRFCMLQRGCVISQYQTERIAFDSFQKNKKQTYDIAEIRGNHLSEFRTYGNGLGLAWDIENFVGAIFGKEAKSIARGIIKGVRSMFLNPQKEFQKQIDNYINRVLNSFSIQEMVGAYEKPCREILDVSMAGYMGKAADMKKLTGELKGILNKNLEWKLEKITLEDMLMEVENGNI